MHIDLRLAQVAVQQQLLHGIPQALLVGAKLALQHPRNIPVGEQGQLAAQHRLIVLGQHTGPTGQLPADQAADGASEQALALCITYPLLQILQVGLSAHVLEQQKALLQVLGKNARHAHTRPLQQAGNANKGFTVLVHRRCIHDDQAALARLPTEVAAKTGVGAGWRQLALGQVSPLQGCCRLWQCLGQPLLHLLLS